MFINPKDCIHYNVCKFAEDAACFEGCDYRKERTTSDNSDYAKCNQPKPSLCEKRKVEVYCTHDKDCFYKHLTFD